MVAAWSAAKGVGVGEGVEVIGPTTEGGVWFDELLPPQAAMQATRAATRPSMTGRSDSKFTIFIIPPASK